MATKCWTEIWPTVNSKWWLTQFYHALKWCKSFLVHQRENKRLGSGILSIPRCWKTIINKKEKPENLKNPEPVDRTRKKKKLKIHTLFRTKDMYKCNSPLYFCLILSSFFLSLFLPWESVYGFNFEIWHVQWLDLIREDLAKMFTLFRRERMKIIPCPAAHPRTGYIRDYPLPGIAPWTTSYIVLSAV